MEQLSVVDEDFRVILQCSNVVGANKIIACLALFAFRLLNYDRSVGTEIPGGKTIRVKHWRMQFIAFVDLNNGALYFCCPFSITLLFENVKASVVMAADGLVITRHELRRNRRGLKRGVHEWKKLKEAKDEGRNCQQRDPYPLLRVPAFLCVDVR